MNEEIKKEIDNLKKDIELQITEHEHDGNQATQVKYFNMFGAAPSNVAVRPATIATTGNTDDYVIAPISGALIEVDFSGVDALATSDTNYITWTITNLGQAGAGSTAMLAAVNGNTTKTTGGTALSVNTKRSLTINSDPNNTKVTAGDRLLIRAAATGTLANTVTFPTYCLRFI